MDGGKPRAQVVISAEGRAGRVDHARSRLSRRVTWTSTRTSVSRRHDRVDHDVGLLGDRYVSLQLGGEEEVLKPGDKIAFTESAVVLERILGKLVYGGSGGKTAPEAPASEQEAP
jgi:hypothetical protein